MSTANATDFAPFDDKDLSTFTPSFDGPLDGLFDQYFPHEGSSDSSDNSNGSNFFEELDMGLSADTAPADPPLSKPTSSPYQSLHSWRANAWRHHKVPPVPQSQKLVYRLRPDGAAISSVELLSLEGKLKIKRPTLTTYSLPPATPPPTPSKARHNARSSTPVTPVRSEHRVSKKKSSPNMMRPSYYAKTESPYHEWTEQFQQFSLQSPMNGFPLTPPPSSKVSQHEQPSRLMMPAHDSHDMETVSPSPISPTTPLQQLSRAQRHTRMPSSDGYIPTMQEARRSASWMQGTHLSYGIEPSQTEYDWASLPQPPSLFEQNLEVHDQNHEYMTISPDFASQGLMIQCEPFEDVFQSTHSSNSYMASAFEPFETDCAVEEDEEYSSDISPAVGGRSGLPHPNSPSQSHSPSPPLSPTIALNARRRSKYHRRKSSAAVTPKTPKTPTSGGGTVGFVNFTPNDSRKILGGVAPSGSSKTKARREKEASDRRRKLSEAAAKAIKEAGGDVEALKKEGLLI